MEFSEAWLDTYMEQYRQAMDAEPNPEDDPEIPDVGLEKVLQAKCLKYCKEHRYPCLSFPQSKKAKGFLTPGWPDMTIVNEHGVVFIELKSKGGKLRTEQDELKRRFNWFKHPIHIVKSYKRFIQIMEGRE